MRDYSEKRDFHRMQVNSEIELTDSNGEKFTGICRDLSAAGMQLFVKRPVAVGEELKTLLHPTGDQIPPLETVCEVLRCEQDREGYLLGTTINEVS
ncbi:PilZ domain-containing protein [Marinobacter sp. M216]|uniref:PilZ domain-containing protein n=1 Tax=Marinobacter albus TaxID=3030833 RepID=A0ABT7HD90_9GAMM|nr:MULTISPECIES: PilZ domain-containing protein [unclassified Marinobacter]MBW7470280.1 PilZ domain-containing protein [Marinobacter sp. F4218]MDK9557455.1 PilZ domain-containing protein [Marinobacter sp. M216]